MYLQVCGEEEKGENTRARSLASPLQAGRGVAWRGDGRVRTTCACIVCRNPAQSLADPRPPFAVYFATSPCLIHLIEIELVGYGTL
jgi:hypothetical protein